MTRETTCQAHQPSCHLSTRLTVTSLLFGLCGVCCPSPGGKHRPTTPYLMLFPAVTFQLLPTKGQRCTLVGSNTIANSRHRFSAFSDSTHNGYFHAKYLYKYQLQLNLFLGHTHGHHFRSTSFAYMFSSAWRTHLAIWTSQDWFWPSSHSHGPCSQKLGTHY